MSSIERIGLVVALGALDVAEVMIRLYVDRTLAGAR